MQNSDCTESQIEMFFFGFFWFVSFFPVWVSSAQSESKCRRRLTGTESRRRSAITFAEQPNNVPFVVCLYLLFFFQTINCKPLWGRVICSHSLKKNKKTKPNPLVQTAGLNAPRYPVKLCRGVFNSRSFPNLFDTRSHLHISSPSLADNQTAASRHTG